MHSNPRSTLDPSMKDVAIARATALREEAIQRLWDAAGRRLGRPLRALAAQLRRLARRHASSDSEMWRHAMHDPRIVAEIQAARDHALALAEVRPDAGRSTAARPSGRTPAGAVMDGAADAAGAGANPVARGGPAAGTPSAPRAPDGSGYRTRMPGWAPRLGSST